MKRFHIFLLLVTAILGFISCDIRSELIGPLNYSDTLYVYHKDTVYISTVDTLYVDCNCGGNTEGDSTTPDNNPDSTPDTNPDSGSDTTPDTNPDNGSDATPDDGSDNGSDTTPDDGGQNPPSEPEVPEEPALPVETLTITVDMTGDNPFTENLRGSQKPEYVEYTLLEGGYKFGFYNAYKSTIYIRLTGNTELGYVKFPAIDEFKLTNITLTSGASSGKYIRVWSEDPLTAAKEFTGFTLLGTNDTADEQSFDVKDTEIGVGYYISAISKNAQFSKLVLTYGKFE